MKTKCHSLQTTTFIIKNMSLNQQIREVPLSYGQLLIMKRRHSLNSMTTNIMKKYRPSQTLSSQHKPTQLPIISRISSNLETLTTKHSNTYCHPHHLAYPSFTSYQKYTSPITQGDQSYQDAIHPRTGSPHSSTHISNHYAVHFPPTSKTPIISCKPYSTSPHHYHPTPFLPQSMSCHNLCQVTLHQHSS